MQNNSGAPEELGGVKPKYSKGGEGVLLEGKERERNDKRVEMTQKG